MEKKCLRSLEDLRSDGARRGTNDVDAGEVEVDALARWQSPSAPASMIAALSRSGDST